MTENAAHGHAPGEDARQEPPQFSVVHGNPTESELAAVTAVVTAMAEELGHDQSSGKPVRSAWAHSQRDIRRPITPGAGAWKRQIV